MTDDMRLEIEPASIAPYGAQPPQFSFAANPASDIGALSEPFLMPFMPCPGGSP